MVAMTGSAVCGSNSVELAPSIPATWRACSMTMACSPRQMPRVGTPRSRAQRRAPILPSMPRTPKPPGTRMASTPPSAVLAPASVRQSSEATHRMSTLASCRNPPARRASVTDR